MIPIKLTIQGLYSYQQKQTIDFTKLTEAHLFGIFGSVGSGKSSILEAITFALYGKTDRLNISGDNRNYNMMNLKSNELLIDFTFETGKDQTAFQAVVKGRRNSKRFEDVKTLERTAYQKTGESWIPIEPEKLEEAIGLSYENFKRTIIVPQGQFHEFLQLGNKDRTKMMKELFNLEKFELYYKVASLESKNNEQKQLIHGQLQQLGEMDPEKAKIFEAQLVQLETERKKQDEKLKKLQKEENQWQQVQELAKKLKSATQTLTTLNKKKHEFIILEKTILQYEKCVLQFKNNLDALEASDRKIAIKTQLIQNETQKLKSQEAEINKKEKFLSEIKPDYETREILKQRAEELEKISKIITLGNKTEAETGRLNKGEKILNDTLKTANLLKSENEKISAHIKEEKQKLPELSLLAEVKTWHIEMVNLEKIDKEIDKEIGKLQNEEKKLKQSVHEMLKSDLFIAFNEKNNIQKVIKHLQQKIEKKKLHIKTLENETNHFRVIAQLEKYAQELHNGKPCPLCGSIHHPKKYSAKNIIDERNKLENRISEVDLEVEKITNTVLYFKDFENRLQFNTKNLSDWARKQAENKLRTEKHLMYFKWPGYENIEVVNNAFNSARIVQEEIKNKETKLEDITKKLVTSQNEKELFQAEIEKIKMVLTACNTEIKTLQEQLKIVSVGQYLSKTPAEIETERNKLFLKYSQLEKQFNELTNQLTDLHKTKNTLSGILNANKQELLLEQKTNSGLFEQLNEKLKQSEYESLTEVKKVLEQPIELEKQKKNIAEFKQDLAFVSSRLQEIEVEMGKRFYDAEAHHKIKAIISEIIQDISAKNQELGKIIELLKKLKKDLETQDKLQKTMEKLEFRAENIKTIKTLFKGGGFVNYISSVYLQNLCNNANDRFFQLTQQKLSLEITEDNNFQVRDFMNGGKVRNVKTLSGGQTFQAAFSLALSLADNIQKITESDQNFFFLDEGFGSLDKESLSVVFNTLKSLRKENRIVGVISHVEEMQQEIEVHLRIENSDETGSIIYQSWKNT